MLQFQLFIGPNRRERTGTKISFACVPLTSSKLLLFLNNNNKIKNEKKGKNSIHVKISMVLSYRLKIGSLKLYYY